jgi:hypothetical protein
LKAVKPSGVGAIRVVHLDGAGDRIPVRLAERE